MTRYAHPVPGALAGLGPLPLVVDLFGGPGGWAEGLRALGLAEIGLEIDPWACATRAAAGHRVIRADVARFPIARLAGRVDGLIASPPCPVFSTAGNGAGRAVLAELAAAIADALAGRRRLGAHRRRIARTLATQRRATTKQTRTEVSAGAWRDATQAALTVEPARWIAATRPRWVAMEQVPPVIGLWRIYVTELRRLGYAATCAIVNAADYGVPQTRQRAVLVARLNGPARLPEPTHARQPGGTLFGARQAWVSMAEALGWTGALDRRQQTNGTPVPLVPTSEPAPTLTGQGGRSQWLVRTGTNSMVTGRTPADCQPYERSIERPAPVVGHKAGKWRLVPGKQARTNDRTNPRPVDQPAPTLAFGHDHAGWAWHRPATTIAGDPRVFPPGSHIADDGRDLTRAVGRSETDVRLSLAEALALQTFPPDYPVQGPRSVQFTQVGNAMPPLLAARVLAAVLDLEDAP